MEVPDTDTKQGNVCSNVLQWLCIIYVIYFVRIGHFDLWTLLDTIHKSF